MVVVTTLSYDQLSQLIRDNRVSINNEDLFIGGHFSAIQSYIAEHLGSDNYVMAICGRINPTSVSLFNKLDRDLAGNKVIIEAQVSRDDMIAFDVKGLDKVVEIINYGLPDSMVTEALDEARTTPSDDGVQIICTPYISKDANVRITSLNREIDVGGAGITFVKLPGTGGMA